MSVVIGPHSSTSPFAMASLKLREQKFTPAVQQIDGQLNAPGRRAFGSEALEQALQRLNKLFDEKNVQISAVYDVRSGAQIRITDGDTGKTITEMPPDAVLEITERAKQSQTGWLIDTLG